MNDAYESTVVSVKHEDGGEIMSVKDWIITLIILSIPLVNIVMMFVWAFGSSAPRTKSNFCKAYLILLAIFFVLYIVLVVVLGVGASMSPAYSQ